MDFTRRTLLRGLGGIAALQLLRLPAVARAAVMGGRSPRLVVVLLRGGLDGLAAVPATGDPHWSRARGGLAEEASGALPLDETFGLDPRLASLHAMYEAGEMLVAHAVALPYRDRSHFDAQNLLESGGTKPFARSDGWVGRALAAHDRSARAVALQPVLPLVARGAAGASSWSPSSLPAPSDALLAQVADLYASEPGFQSALAEARRAHRLVAGTRAARRRDPGFPMLAAVAGAFLADPDGPDAAVLELGGWDSHNLQTLPQGGLSQSLRRLDRGLVRLKERLGDRWRDTVVVVSTEFGRTVAMNGSQGTDHGTAGAAFLLGGAVAGGRVVTDWPGLGAKDLYEGRDLRPTTDLRALWKGVLHEHLHVSKRALARTVFPESTRVTPLVGLVRSG